MNFLITICNKKKRGNIFIDSKKKIIKNYNSKKNNSDLVEVGYMIINKDVILNSFRNKNESFSYLIKERIKINKVNYYLRFLSTLIYKMTTIIIFL